MSAANPLPLPILRHWAKHMMSLEAYIEERCLEAGTKYIRGSGWSADGEAAYEFAEFGGREAVAYNSIIAPIPSGVWITFKTCVENRPSIRRRFSLPIIDLIQDPGSGEVFGVVCREGTNLRYIKARKAVVLAVGGYEADLAMQRDYYGFPQVYPLGTPANSGDGIRILQKAGAALWHMRNFGQSFQRPELKKNQPNQEQTLKRRTSKQPILDPSHVSAGVAALLRTGFFSG